MWSEPPQGYRYPCSRVVRGTEAPFSTLGPWLSFWRIFRGFVENIHSNPNRKSLPGSRQPLGSWFSWCLEETSQGWGWMIDLAQEAHIQSVRKYMTGNGLCSITDLKLFVLCENWAPLGIIFFNVILNYSFKRMWFPKIKETFNMRENNFYHLRSVNFKKSFEVA